MILTALDMEKLTGRLRFFVADGNAATALFDDAAETAPPVRVTSEDRTYLAEISYYSSQRTTRMELAGGTGCAP